MPREVFRQRLRIEAAARLARAPGETLPVAEEIVGQRDGGLHTDSITCGSTPISQPATRNVASVALLLLTRLRAARGLARVEIIPVHDRVEAERVSALRLPPPERAQREHHH